MRRFTNVIEEYGIDEGFAELTGLRRAMKMNYIDMAEEMERQLQKELGITFYYSIKVESSK